MLTSGCASDAGAAEAVKDAPSVIKAARAATRAWRANSEAKIILMGPVRMAQGAQWRVRMHLK
jgi:hypothetical protein